MKAIHLTLDEENRKALCGSPDYAGRVGHGVGMINPAVLSKTHHCPECIAVYRGSRPGTSTAVSVSKDKSKPTVKDLVTSQMGQEVKDRLELLSELNLMRSEVARLRLQLSQAEADNDRILTELLQERSAKTLAHRELYDAILKTLQRHAPKSVSSLTKS